MKTLIIDNYDSYTFNLYQLIAEVSGTIPLVIRNDQMSWEELEQLELDWQFDNVVISPGPGRPEKAKDFGICRAILENVTVPVLGVCLGHQGLGHVYGSRIIYAPEVRHGRLSEVYHHGVDLFKGVPSPFSVVRYHSLLVEDHLPDCLEKTAWTQDGLVMGLRHRQLPLWGVQFHPESICTEYGRVILENFRDLTHQFQQHDLTIAANQKVIKQHSIELNVSHPHSPEYPDQKIDQHSPEYSDQKIDQQQSEFQLCTRKLNRSVDSEQLFVQLYAESSNAFWLDSSRVEPGLSRFSFMGDGSGANSLLIRYHSQTKELTVAESEVIACCNESIFDYLKREIQIRKQPSNNLPFDFNCGFVGYFGYELKAECGSDAVHQSSLPDAMFLFADRMIAIDHQEQTIYLLCLTQKDQTAQAESWFDEVEVQLENLNPLPEIVPDLCPNPVVFRFSRLPRTYLSDIHESLHEIHEGETYQVCLTNQIKTDARLEPLYLYRTLRRINPAPYSAFFRFSDVAIACSSPERFLKIDTQGWAETKPIKGTLPRSESPEEDEMLRERLRTSEKDRAENLMVVDLLRNDLSQVCEIGSVHVPKLMAVETYATVHQLVTTVRGKLRPDVHAVDCIRAAFPGGSMTGAPKLRTLEIIDRLEQEARGIYSGAIGFLGLNGSADLNIVIRTAVLTPEETTIGVGGGIVALSDPDLEYREMLLKAKALLHAIVLTLHGTIEPDRYHFLNSEPEGAESSQSFVVVHQSQNLEGKLFMDQLSQFRQEIDNLDTQIIEALGKRFEVCRQVAHFKKATKIPMMQPGRVEEVKRRRQELGLQHSIDADFMLNLYSLIIQESCRIEDEIIENELVEEQV
jgi:para-aminobenzoate synthetase